MQFTQNTVYSCVFYCVSEFYQRQVLKGFVLIGKLVLCFTFLEAHSPGAPCKYAGGVAALVRTIRIVSLGKIYCVPGLHSDCQRAVPHPFLV